jgi:hypothetical protein
LVIVALLANNGEYSGECKLELFHLSTEGPPSEVHHSVIRSGPKEKLDMDAVYKRHDIHAGAWELLYPIGWEPHFYIGWWEAGQNIFKNFTINEIFSTREEAERAGLLFAQKWVDDGK